MVNGFPTLLHFPDLFFLTFLGVHGRGAPVAPRLLSEELLEIFRGLGLSASVDGGGDLKKNPSDQTAGKWQPL